MTPPPLVAAPPPPPPGTPEPNGKGHGFEVFVFGSLTVKTPPILVGNVNANEFEAIGVAGYSFSEGPYLADIFARGLSVGDEENYVAVFGGKEFTSDGEAEDIIIVEGSVSFRGKCGLFAGAFETGPDSHHNFQKGVFVGISGGKVGEHGSVGIGFTLPSWKSIKEFFDPRFGFPPGP